MTPRIVTPKADEPIRLQAPRQPTPAALELEPIVAALLAALGLAAFAILSHAFNWGIWPS
jgi:hypothetical protein